MKINLRLKVKNVEFSIACEKGEEEKIKKLAESINRRLSLLSQSFPGVNLMNLLLINSIMIEDEVGDLKNHNKDLSNALEEKKIITDNQISEDFENNQLEYEDIANYIEQLIETIEN